MKQNKNRISIVIYNSDIELLKAGKPVHWGTTINGKLYKIVQTYHSEYAKMSNRQDTTKGLNSSTDK